MPGRRCECTPPWCASHPSSFRWLPSPTDPGPRPGARVTSPCRAWQATQNPRSLPAHKFPVPGGPLPGLGPEWGRRDRKVTAGVFALMFPLMVNRVRAWALHPRSRWSQSQIFAPARPSRLPPSAGERPLSALGLWGPLGLCKECGFRLEPRGPWPGCHAEARSEAAAEAQDGCPPRVHGRTRQQPCLWAVTASLRDSSEPTALSRADEDTQLSRGRSLPTPSTRGRRGAHELGAQLFAEAGPFRLLRGQPRHATDGHATPQTATPNSVPRTAPGAGWAGLSRGRNAPDGRFLSASRFQFRAPRITGVFAQIVTPK